MAFTALTRSHEISVAELPTGDYVVSVAGIVDGTGAAELRDIVYPLTAAAARIVVDLGNAVFVDSSATGIIDGASRLAGATGGAIVVCTRDPRIRSQLATAGSTARVEPALGAAIGSWS
jgi:anti-anti-sigma factor